MKNYLAVVVDMITSVVVPDASSLPTLRWKYGGCLGSRWIMVSPLNIAITSNMVGRSDAFSCTHKSAMLRHLIISTE